jgi:ribosomal protein S18 acetylase RimI-like enzyme
MPHKVASLRVSVDYNKDMAMAGFDSPQPYAQMVCLGRYIRGVDDSAEVGLVVKESFQNVGIGSYMMEQLIKAAEQHGIKKLVASVGRNNTCMLSIFRKNGFTVTDSKIIDGHFCSLNIEAHKADLAHL